MTDCDGWLIIFFQAEDGIRDLTVTGVQTCALPILIALFALFASSVLTPAQQVKIAPDQQYVNLEIVKVATLAEELNDAGKQGFRLKMSEIGRASCRERV